MARLSAGHVLLGLVLLAAGGALLVAAASGAPLVQAVPLPVSGPLLAGVAGGVLALGGVLAVAASVRREEEEAPSIPAHVAFVSKPPAAPDDVSEAMADLAPRRPKPRAPPARGGEIDARIRELTREINKAGVMLATGKLSGEGYAQYVEELKRQRGELEARRIHGEMGGGVF